MSALKQLGIHVAKLFLFWILVFDFQRLMFSIHNWDKFAEVSWMDWLGTFVYSLRLDLSSASYLIVLPLIILIIRFIFPSKWMTRLFVFVMAVEAVMVAMIHAGEINAYPEWNHKLTTRVFMHLSNPDEVVRTADYGMTVWFIIYSALELMFAWRIFRWLLKSELVQNTLAWYYRLPVALGALAVCSGGLVLIARGGVQQIPINIDSAYFSEHYTVNDLSVNSAYFFGQSYIIYNRSEIGDFIPSLPEEVKNKNMQELHEYEFEHDQMIFNTDRPNLVFIILESWTGKAVGSLTGEKSATPNFDRLAQNGLLFTNVYATGGTSEIGNASIFGGYPALPEISITTQPEKHRKLPCLNEDLNEWGYTSHYIFSGDLKYGNIGSYFIDHGFDVVEDESDFPRDLPRGKLNYFDEDLYKILLKKINNTKEPFLHCAFTGSTHSPYDYPNKEKFTNWTGAESGFMNSIEYADDCLNKFFTECKKEEWYENTIFVVVADHGHASPSVQNPSLSAYFHIPLLFYGEPLKKEYRGKKIETLGSQTDIVRTLLYQMKGDYQRYIWSKDLLNPNCPEYALHTINRGYGWVTKNGNFTYHMDSKQYLDNSLEGEFLKQEVERCQSLMSAIFEKYKEL